jgi:hypothetical protein
MTLEEAIEVLGEVRQIAESCLASAENMSTLPIHIHFDGLKDGMRAIIEEIPTNEWGEVDGK